MLLNIIRQPAGAPFLLRFLGALAFGFAAGALPACHSIASDCTSVCTRYRDCVDSKYDVAGCESRCESKAGQDRDFDDRLTHCQSCSEGRTCSEVVANCIPACVGVVP